MQSPRLSLNSRAATEKFLYSTTFRVLNTLKSPRYLAAARVTASLRRARHGLGCGSSLETTHQEEKHQPETAASDGSLDPKKFLPRAPTPFTQPEPPTPVFVGGLLFSGKNAFLTISHKNNNIQLHRLNCYFRSSTEDLMVKWFKSIAIVVFVLFGLSEASAASSALREKETVSHKALQITGKASNWTRARWIASTSTRCVASHVRV